MGFGRRTGLVIFALTLLFINIAAYEVMAKANEEEAAYRERAIKYLVEKYGVSEGDIHLSEGVLRELPYIQKRFWAAKYAPKNIGRFHRFGGLFLDLDTGRIYEKEEFEQLFEQKNEKLRVQHLIEKGEWIPDQEMRSQIKELERRDHWAAKVFAFMIRNGFISGLFAEEMDRPVNPFYWKQLVSIILGAGPDNPAGIDGSLVDSQTDKLAKEGMLPRERAIEGLMKLIAVAGYRESNQEQPVRSLASFSDGDRVSERARPAMIRAVELGLIRGYPDGSLRPEDPLTLAEGVSVLDRVVRVFGLEVLPLISVTDRGVVDKALEIALTDSEVNQWYQDHLGKNFVRYENGQAYIEDWQGVHKAATEWAREVEKHRPEPILYFRGKWFELQLLQKLGQTPHRLVVRVDLKTGTVLGYHTDDY